MNREYIESMKRNALRDNVEAHRKEMSDNDLFTNPWHDYKVKQETYDNTTNRSYCVCMYNKDTNEIVSVVKEDMLLNEANAFKTTITTENNSIIIPIVELRSSVDL